MFNFNYRQTNSGLAALMIVVIVGAAALTMAVSTALLGVRELELATTSDRGAATKALADGCLDTALLALRLNPSQGDYEFTLPAGACIITVSNEGGGDRR